MGDVDKGPGVNSSFSGSENTASTLNAQNVLAEWSGKDRIGNALDLQRVRENDLMHAARARGVENLNMIHSKCRLGNVYSKWEPAFFDCDNLSSNSTSAF